MNNITNSFSQILFWSACMVTMLACSTMSKVNKDPLSHITDLPLKNILNKAFDRKGGIHNWNTIQTLQFRKKTILYLSSGEIEKESDQVHTYQYAPTKKVTINWKDAKGDHIIELADGTAVKKVNQQIDKSANSTSLKNNIYAATFVMGIPFKLTDKGAELSYEGLQTIPSGKEVHVVKAIYDADKHSNLTKSDTWWHYFEKDTYKQVGYSVALHDHTSYIEDYTYEEEGGFLFTSTRKSWRMNDKGEKLYLRAEYEYSNFEVR